MKITFLNPPSEPVKSRAPDRNFGCNYGVSFQQPIQILYPAAVLEKAGFEVEFIDCPVEKMSAKWLEEYIQKTDSQAFVFFTVYLSEDIDKYWANKIRELKPEAFVIFSGAEPTRKPNDFIFDERFFVVRGEPELVLLDLMNALAEEQKLNNILSLSWMQNKAIKNNAPRRPIENLDDLPFPARHLIKDISKYYNPKLMGRPTTTMFTSRQCWAQCIYCIPSALTFAREIEGRRATGVVDNEKGEIKDFAKALKPPMRFRSPENIYEEFKQLKEMGYKSVLIMDDNFLGLTKSKPHKDRVIKICQLIEPLQMEWGCLARADESQDEEILDAMKKAGCKFIDIGIESFDQRVLNYVNKGLKVEDNISAILKIQKHKMEPKVNLLLGAAPMQDEKTIKKDVEVLKSLNVKNVQFGIVNPHPATQMYNIVKQEGWFKGFATNTGQWKGIDTYREGIVDFPDMPHEKLEKLVKWCYRSYYLRPVYILSRLKEIRSLRQFVEYSKTAYNLIFRGEA
jgi:radical SAM superfamily enzyme YgiQ (UPF0313 family)